MTPLTCLQSLQRHAALLAALLSLLPAGCAERPTPAPPLVGNWQGAMAAGHASVRSVWVIRADGTQSVTLTLPQGAMTAEGTWTAQTDVLTERTTTRVIVLGGEPKVVVLASPMETTFAYQITGDTLTLTRPDTHQQIVLTRGAGTQDK